MASTELVARPNGAVAAPERHAEWERKLDLIQRTVAKGCTKDELDLFLYQARRTGLDPLARQIYCIRRRSGDEYHATIQTGIDGYRLIADRTGLYAGNDDAVFEGTHHLTNDRESEVTAPEAATITVWKIVGGQRCPFTATARWREYYPGDRQGQMWKRMPYTMLAKCAEGLALRKAFPADLSGIYTHDEMSQADKEREPQPPPLADRRRVLPPSITGRVIDPLQAAGEPPADEPPPEAYDAEPVGEAEVAPSTGVPPATPAQHEAIARMGRQLGRAIDTKGLSKAQASQVITSLSAELDRQQPVGGGR